MPGNLVYVFDSAGEKCRNVALLDDNEVEGNHLISAIISSNNLGIFAEGSKNITIVDTDGMLEAIRWMGLWIKIMPDPLCL